MPPVPRPGKKAQAAGQNRNRNLLIALGGVAVVAVVLVVGGLLLGGGDGGGDGATTSPTTALLDGIPQDGTVLGSPDAEVTLIEYADLQCPVCQRYSEDAFATLVEEYVATGKVKMEFRGLSFLGPDSETALRHVQAAGLQDKLWQMQDALYANQGEENKSWVTDDLLRSVGETVPGLDVDRMFDDASSQEVTDEIEESSQQAQDANVPGTPWFFIQIGEDDPYEIQPSSLTPDAFRPALDDALSG